MNLWPKKCNHDNWLITVIKKYPKSTGSDIITDSSSIGLDHFSKNPNQLWPQRLDSW